jgi:transcription elongation factor Elf1
MKIICPHCGNDDKTMIDVIPNSGQLFCNVCAKRFEISDGRNSASSETESPEKEER